MADLDLGPVTFPMLYVSCGLENDKLLSVSLKHSGDTKVKNRLMHRLISSRGIKNKLLCHVTSNTELMENRGCIKLLSKKV